ncbi:MAG: YejL family protein [Vibrio hibernica]
MPINSKYSDQKIEQILAEIAAVLKKHEASSDLSLMIAGNIVTNILNSNVPRVQRKLIADKFSQALLSSLDA